MDKIKGTSLDIVKENILKLKEIFPEAFCENKIDFQKLKEVLGDYVEDKEERYRFEWHGKSKSIRLSQTPSRGTLRPYKEESKNWDTTENLYIEGDNLEVLKLLQKSYQSKIKMIYIDPPYNIGNELIYNDDYKDNLKHYLEMTKQVDESQNKTSTNSETNGRYHTKWLNMMYPRLRLARNLLTDDGSIFISIDDNEVANLKKMCDEIFGDENFVAIFPWRKRTAKSDVPFGISQDFEWIIVYSKANYFIAGIQNFNRKYYESNDYPGRPWRIHSMTKQTSASERPNSYFDLINPKTKKHYPANPNAVWRITKDTFEDYYKDGRIIFPGDYDFLNISSPVLRYFKDDDEKKAGERFGYTAVSTFLPKEVGMTQNGTKTISNIFYNKVFNYSKSVELLFYLINIATKNDKDDIVLDFFSGSATTAHATMQLNSKDNGNRKFIMIQLPELKDENSEAFKAGFKNVCEIGKERIRRAGDKILEENSDKKGIEDLDIGFKVFKLDSSNIKPWNPDFDSIQLSLKDMVDNFIPNRSEEDVVYEIMLKYGIDLTYPIEVKEVNEKKVFSIGFGALIICLDNYITLDVVHGIVDLKNKLNPQATRVVFKDNGFKNDTVKTNALEILKKNNFEEVLSI